MEEIECTERFLPQLGRQKNEMAEIDAKANMSVQQHELRKHEKATYIANTNTYLQNQYKPTKRGKHLKTLFHTDPKGYRRWADAAASFAGGLDILTVDAIIEAETGKAKYFLGFWLKLFISFYDAFYRVCFLGAFFENFWWFVIFSLAIWRLLKGNIWYFLWGSKVLIGFGDVFESF